MRSSHNKKASERNVTESTSICLLIKVGPLLFAFHRINLDWCRWRKCMWHDSQAIKPSVCDGEGDIERQLAYTVHLTWYINFCVAFLIRAASAAGESREGEFSVPSVRRDCARRITGKRPLHGLCQNEICRRQQSKNVSTEEVSRSSADDGQRTAHQTRFQRRPDTSTSRWVYEPSTWRWEWWWWRWRSLVWYQRYFRTRDHQQRRTVCERSVPAVLWTIILGPVLRFLLSIPLASHQFLIRYWTTLITWYISQRRRWHREY